MGRMVTQQNLTHVRSSIPSDVATVANGMRPEDVAEVKAQSGSDPKGGLLFCFFMSKPCMTLIGRHGKPIAMWGVVPNELGSGRIWLLGHQSMFEDPCDKGYFLRESKIQLAKLHKQYSVLFNEVDARNKVHIRWLQWMGFTFIRKHPQWGPEARPFYEFVRI